MLTRAGIEAGMASQKLIVYADLNCPFCYTLHERLLELDYLNQVEWRCVEHAPGIKYDANDLHAHAELINEINRLREVAPDTHIIVPPSRSNSLQAIELVTEAFLQNPAKAIELRTLIYRSLWQEGLDFDDQQLLQEFCTSSGLPDIKVQESTKQLIREWKSAWEEGDYSRNIPAMIDTSQNKLLGLPSYEMIRAAFKGYNPDEFEEGAFCYLKPKEKILIASENDVAIDQLANALNTEFQIEIAQSGELVLQTCIADNPPDLILMDTSLQNPDGFKTCLEIKDIPQIQNISVILFSDEHQIQKEVHAFDVGATDFIVIPCAKEVLKARVRVLLRLKRTTDLLEQFSRLDSLTEIPNRREFGRVLEGEWLRAKRAHKPISLILIDVDYFKKYNDHYGHSEGDQCLKQVAQVIENNIRRSHDTVARYGGEEFVVILPETDKEGAIQVAEQVKQGIANANIQHEHSKVSDYITISQGISTIVPTIPLTPRNLIDTADVALYAAKNAGRNRYMFNKLQEND